MNFENIANWFQTYPVFAGWIYLIIVLFVCLISYYLTRKILIRAITSLLKKTKTDLDDILLEEQVFNRLAFLVPIIIFYQFKEYLPIHTSFLQQLLLASIVLILLLVTGSLISSVNKIYEHLVIGKKIPLKSYLQIVKIVLYVLGGITIVSILLGKSPWGVLSGIGALTAVIMLIFRDTILSFVASIQISSSDMLQVGDWIEAPAYGTDGDVIDIALHHIKIQNWDKTISTIPTYKLIDSSFKNWRGMSASGGRRVKRSIHIDVSSIQFCTPTMLNKYKSIQLISDYLDQKLQEVETYNTEHEINTSELINGRRVTNIGTFRNYIIRYLQAHPNVHKEMTLLVRQLQPTENGLPIELYFFTNDIDWIKYEEIQSNIFDHILAAISEFDLRIFQNPTGSDFKNLLKQ
ncbi:MAG: mechanosensitive ion channel [Candidatus Marinimicrobia bacterium]|nr:mechanosensitive ion channel [Candidatus Neomarinimicrobiota bacterium]